MDHAAELTELVRRMQSGDRQAAESVFTVAAARLRSISASLLSNENRSAGFQASDLVQEVFKQKLAGMDQLHPVNGREHFFSLIAHGMRQILVDRARRRAAVKRQKPPVSEWLSRLRPNPCQGNLIAALHKLERLDPTAHRIVRLKNDHGMTWDEIAVETGIPRKRARAEYDYAIRILRREIS